MGTLPSRLLVFLVVLLLAGCTGQSSSTPVEGTQSGATHSPPWFVEASRSAGVAFSHQINDERRYYMPETIGGGVALIDHDGDGDLDIYLVQSGVIGGDRSSGPGNQLFRNDGELHFTDVTSEAGVGDRGYGIGVTCGDCDRDGDVDIYVTNLGANVLYLNDGNGTFTDVSREAGVADAGFGSSAAFGDLDGDRYPELFISNYIRWSKAQEIDCQSGMGTPDYCSPNNYLAPAPDSLYRNNGDGTFENVSNSSGIRAVSGNGLGVTLADFDGDQLTDIYVANDGTPNQLWRNLGNGSFVDVAVLSGCAVNIDGASEAGMGVQGVDCDEDGDLDLFMSHIRNETNTFYRNDGGNFTDTTVLTGLAAASRDFTGFGLGFHDFDHDGVLDLYVANGRVLRGAKTYREDAPYAEPNQIFRGLGNGRFKEVLPRGGTATELIETSRGTAFGDLDGDGDIDIVVANSGGPARILINEAPKVGGSVTFELVDFEGCESPGTPLVIEIGERKMHRRSERGYSYCASNDPRVHVGLGGAEGVDRVTVRWPGGKVDVYPGPFTSGSTVTLRESP